MQTAVFILSFLIFRVHDIYTNRILQVLMSMQTVTLHALPEEEPWTVEEFLQQAQIACRNAALVIISNVFFFV